MLHDNVTHHDPEAGLLSQVISGAAGDTNGTGSSLAGHHSCTFIANIGESGDTLSGSVKLDLRIQESDDDVTYTDVTDADYIVDGLNSAFVASGTGIFATIDDAADDDVLVSIGYVGPSAYARVIVTTTGTHTNGIEVGIINLLGNPRKAA